MEQALSQSADCADKLIRQARELKQTKKNSKYGHNGKTNDIKSGTRGIAASLNDNTQKPVINGIVGVDAKSSQFDLLDPRAYRYSKISYYFIFF